MRVFIIAAMSADGFIARSASEATTAWTSPDDKKRFVGLTRQAGALVMGRKTFETFGRRPLKGRDLFVYSRQSGAGTWPDQPSLPDGPGTVSWTNLPPAGLVRELSARGYRELAVCGGAEIYSQFLEAGVVDGLCLTIEPRLFGQGTSLFSRSLDLSLELLKHEVLPSGTQFIDYRIKGKK